METEKIIKGKRILVVDDEKDILEAVADLLSMCRIDTASSFEQAKDLLGKSDYDVAILDIMGVKGYELLKITKSRKIPTIMFTAHALSAENLKRSVQEGADYYAPKEKIEDLPVFIADVLTSVEERKSPWQKMFDRLAGFYDQKFGGPDWRESERAFWEEKFKEMPYL